MSQTKAQLIEGKGSATFDGDLTVDTNTLYVDSTNNRVGLGTSTVDYPLTIQNTSRPQVHVSYNGNGGLFVRDATDTARINWEVSTSQYIAGAFQITPSTTAGGTTFTTPAITIDSSSRVGIGTAPAFGAIDHGLHIKGSGAQEGIRLETTDGSGGILEIYSENGGNTLDTRGSGYIRFNTQTTEWGRWDSSGRFLVGTSTSFGGGYGAANLQVSGPLNGDPAEISLRRNYAGLNGSGMGAIAFYSPEGRIAQITGNTNGTQTAGTASPGALVFSTTADGSSSPTERMRIDKDGNLFSAQTYASTTVNAANINIQPDGRLYRSTSSVKYKSDVETLEDQYADAVLNCRPVWYHSTANGDNPDWSYWGFIAEEVAEIDPRLVSWKTVEISYDERGSVVTTPCTPEPEGVQYDRFVPHLLNLIKRQSEAIADLQAKVAALEGA